MTRPPRLGEWLMTWSIAAADRPAMLGDLAEEFGARVEQLGVRAARRWYWRQVRHSLGTNVRRRFIEPVRSVSAWGSALRQDIRYALRSVHKEPGFTGAMVLLLALGVGANTALFSVVNVLLLHPYPFPHPEQLVSLDAYHVNGQNRGAGYVGFLDWERESNALDALAIEPVPIAVTLTGRGPAERVNGAQTTAGFLRVLMVQPSLGRFFTPDEDQPGAPRVVVLSYAAWQSRFGARADIVGSAVHLDGTLHTIIGVMPASFPFPSSRTCEFWSPLRENPSNSRRQHQYGVLARLKPGATIESAQADLSALAERLARQFPETNTGWRIAVKPLGAELAEHAGRAVTALFAAGLLVLVLVCLNLAGLSLARGSRRGREIAVCAALGASRSRIVRQLLTESLMLAALGGALSLVVAWWLLTMLRTSASAALGVSNLLRLDMNVLVFAGASSLLVGVVCGMAPAFYGSTIDINAVLKSGSASGRARSRDRLISGLVVGELSVSLILLVGASVLSMEVLSLLRSDTGLQPDRVLTFMLRLPSSRYPSAPERLEFYQTILARLQATAGVEAAGAVSSLPMSGQFSGVAFQVDGRPVPAAGMELRAQGNIASHGYFRSMGIAVVRGREFGPSDTAASMPVAIISEALARQAFPDEDPLGRRLISGRGRNGSTIVGVVASVKHQGPTLDAGPQIYSPLAQTPMSSGWITIRAARNPAALTPAVRAVVAGLDPDVPIERVRTMSSIVAESVSQQQLTSTLVSAFSLFALIVAALGVYVVVSSSVAARRREIGIRVALGASTGTILVSFVRKGAWLATIAAVIGIPAAWACVALLAPLVPGITHQPIVIAAAAIALALVAFVASYVPARRAARLDPLSVLRAD